MHCVMLHMPTIMFEATRAVTWLWILTACQGELLVESNHNNGQTFYQIREHTLPWQCRLPLVVSGGGACRSSASAGVATDKLADA